MNAPAKIARTKPRVTAELAKAFETNRAAIRAATTETLAERIAREKAVVAAEQKNRKPVADDFWRFRTGPDGEDDSDPAFGPNSHRYWGRI